jgi:hypothetical protein
MALVLNPDLDFRDLNYAHQPFKSRNAFGRVMLAPVLRLLCLVWRSMAESGMSLTRVVSVDGDRIMVDPSRPRHLNTKELHDLEAPRSPLFSGRFVSDGFDRLANLLGDKCFAYEDQEAKD